MRDINDIGMSFLRWLAQSGPNAPKHSEGWAHPIAACLLHYIVMIPTTIFVHDAIVSQQLGDVVTDSIDACFRSPTSTLISNFFACYAASLLVWRLITIRAKLGPMHQRAVLYEYTWLCNSTLIMVSIGLRTCRPILATSFCVAVSIDQLLWWVDLAGWMLSGFESFPIGVAQYLTWPKTSWSTRITATHHLWTIPLALYAVGGRMQWASYLLSVFVVTPHVLLSRLLTPFTIQRRRKADDRTANVEDDKYLNVNLCHEVWKDIKFGFVQIKRDNPSVGTYLFRLLWRWNIFNLATFALLCGITKCFDSLNA